MTDSDLNWEDLRTFLICARSGSFRRAADELGVQSSTVKRRVERLEKSLDLSLFARLANGIQLTAEGSRLRINAQRFEESDLHLRRELADIDTSRRGHVRIAATEGLGAFWLMPQLVVFERAHPLLLIDMRCTCDTASLRTLEADIAIQLAPATEGELVQRRLGTLHVYLFASRQYLSLYGRPKSAADMLNHRLVDQIGEQLDQGAWQRALGVSNLEGVVGLRSNSSTAIYTAILSGGGIGALPNYSLLHSETIVPVDVGLKHQMDIWMTYHPEAIKVPRVRAVADWLVRCFDPKKYPWFGPEFIHPDKLRAENVDIHRYDFPNHPVLQ